MTIEPSERAREAYIQLFNPQAFDRQRILAGEWDAVSGLQIFARFESEARKDERERCANVVDACGLSGPLSSGVPDGLSSARTQIAAAIRVMKGQG
ncbi:hypothetical protein HHL08_15895 [Sphingobium sp. AR-3-1]|uniref:Uncharacterized protein n=1 Tax=Sphingobium psychrophilum TaxID=2728834 RepID=A0A7X9WXA0_9SPHN|nr:hypothetical protein [Sphingobium psychrophilum]NML11613.1 hypothetical protein [Sphingobium psychrophilum]